MSPRFAPTTIERYVQPGVMKCKWCQAPADFCERWERGGGPARVVCTRPLCNDCAATCANELGVPFPPPALP